MSGLQLWCSESPSFLILRCCDTQSHTELFQLWAKENILLLPLFISVVSLHHPCFEASATQIPILWLPNTLLLLHLLNDICSKTDTEHLSLWTCASELKRWKTEELQLNPHHGAEEMRIEARFPNSPLPVLGKRILPVKKWSVVSARAAPCNGLRSAGASAHHYWHMSHLSPDTAGRVHLKIDHWLHLKSPLLWILPHSSK